MFRDPTDTRMAGQIFSAPGAAGSFDPGNLAGTMGREVAQTASVTLIPYGEQTRVIEKNDGDPTLYQGHPSSPNLGTPIATGEQYANPRGTDFGTRALVGAQEMMGRQSFDGDDWYTPPYTANPNAREYNPSKSLSAMAGNRQAARDRSAWETAEWMKGTNSYVTDSYDY